jgi:3',5'-cyclic AMP phosphodiesterase CpdA
VGRSRVSGGRTSTPSVTVLHISDTQFGQYHRFGSGVESLGSHLIRDLRDLVGGAVPPIDLIVLSGDIAERGLWSEFQQALAFLDDLLAFTALPRDRVVVVPGNHDVNWGKSKAYFADCESEEREPREPFTRKWRFYQQFVAQLHGEAAFTEEQPYRLHRFDDLRLVVAALNSTWRESHRDEDHYGYCGREQLSWFEDQLRDLTDVARIGVVHHNARRRATADNENLRDADDLENILGPHLDLLLHGHTHDGKEDRLPGGTPVLATGSTAVNPQWRPDEVPNQYQILELSQGTLTRSGRQWDASGQTWGADPRVDRRRNRWQVQVRFDPPGWRVQVRFDPPGWQVQGRVGYELTRLLHAADEAAKREDFAAQVEHVTRLDVGPDAVVERKTKGDPPLHYLIAVRRAAPLRCVGVLDGPLDEVSLGRFEALVFEPLLERGAAELVLVHRGEEVPALRNAARRRGVRVKTWTEYNDLLEPSAYTRWLQRELKSDNALYPQELYLEQRHRSIDRLGKIDTDVRGDLVGEVYDAMLEEKAQFVLLLGDAGYGKSFLVRRLAYLMLGNDRCGVTPIVVYLRDRDKSQSIDEMVASVLIPSRAAFDIDRFQHSLEAGTLALLIDGYDEFAVRVGYVNAAAQLRTFITALRGRAKILLTTRPNHFRSADEVTSALFGELRRVQHGRVYQLEPFDEQQQRAFLTRWFELRRDQDAPATTGRWMAALGNVDNLPELAKTPRMLSFMVQDLDLAEIEAAAGGGTVTAADLYQRLVNKWLAEEAAKIDPKDERAVPPEERQRILEELALELWRIGERDATEQSLHAAARQLDLSRHKLTLDQAAQVLGGRTLLQVGDNRWRFAHQSVWEFLLAKRLAARLRAGDGLDVLGEAELTSLTIRFIRDLAPAEAAVWGTHVATGGSAERP